MKATLKKLIVDTPYVSGEKVNHRPTAVLKAFVRPEQPMDDIRIFWGAHGTNLKELLCKQL